MINVRQEPENFWKFPHNYQNILKIFCTKLKKIIDKSIIILYDFIKVTGNLIGYVTGYVTGCITADVSGRYL